MRGAVAKQQCVVLVGLEDLLAAAFAAHDQQAAVCDQRGRCDQRPQPGEDAGVELAHQPGDALDLQAGFVQQRDHRVDPGRRRPEVGHAGRLVDLQRDDVRVVGDEADQVELAEQAQHPVALAHEQPVHAVAHHQPQRLEQLGVRVDLDEVEAGHVAHREPLRRLGAKQRVAQVGGGEDAQPLGAAGVVDHQRAGRALLGHAPAHADQVERAVDVEGLAQEGVAHPRSDQRDPLALQVAASVVGNRHRGSRMRSGVGAPCPQPRDRSWSRRCAAAASARSGAAGVSVRSRPQRRCRSPSAPAGRGSRPCPGAHAGCRRAPRTARCR